MEYTGFENILPPRVLGPLIAILFLWVGFSSWQELQRFPATPEVIPMEMVSQSASEQSRWVHIEGILWDCQNIVYSSLTRNSRTEIIFFDHTQTLLGVATFNGKLTCDEIALRGSTGTVQRMTDRAVPLLQNRGFHLERYPNARDYVDFCSQCGPLNSLILVCLSSLMVPLGLLIYPLYRRAQRKQIDQENEDIFIIG
jgi:hypothetical protein